MAAPPVLVVLSVFLGSIDAYDQVVDHRHMGKLEHIADAQFVVKMMMKHDLEHGKVFCTNRTNPLAPLVKPFCQDNDGNDLEPVCSLTEKIPDPVLGCPSHEQNINTK